MPVPEEIQIKAKSLRETIEYHSYLYHVKDTPEISDQEYDQLMRELINLESTYPELFTADSPTQRVGGAPLTVFHTVKHPVPLLSLDNAFDATELRSFDSRVKRALDIQNELEYTAELKIDGLTVALTYENGILVQAATRGNGEAGEDVSANVKTIKSIPLKLATPIPHLVIRGEIYIQKADFEELNQQREQTAQPLFANPRNAAAGALRQLDPKITAGRPLDAFFYDILFFGRSKGFHPN